MLVPVTEEGGAAEARLSVGDGWADTGGVEMASAVAAESVAAESVCSRRRRVSRSVVTRTSQCIGIGTRIVTLWRSVFYRHQSWQLEVVHHVRRLRPQLCFLDDYCRQGLELGRTDLRAEPQLG